MINTNTKTTREQKNTKKGERQPEAKKAQHTPSRNKTTTRRSYPTHQQTEKQNK